MNTNAFAQVQSSLDLAASLGDLAPKSLVAAVEAYGAASEAAGAEAVSIDVEALTVTAAKVPDLLERASLAALRGQVLGQVRGELLDRLGRRIVAEVRSAGPAIVDKLAEEFNGAAEIFTAAFRRLPANYADAAQLVDAGADAVASYERARAAMHVLDGLRARRDFLARLGVKAAGPASVERGTRYTSV